MKRIILWLSVLFAILMLPIFPHGKINPADPISIHDKRVYAQITDKDLKQIMEMTRKPTWGGFWALVLRAGDAIPVSSVSDTAPGKIFVKKENTYTTEIIPPVGDISVVLSKPSKPLRGSGRTYIFDRKNGEWVLIQRSSWIS